MELIILGDIHGKWNVANGILNHEMHEDGYALSTGDLCSYNFQPKNGQRLIFCHGNHESFEYMSQLIKERSKKLIPLIPGEVFRLPDETTIAGLPGVFSQHFYDYGGKLKYYSQEDIKKILKLKDRIDILLTHEAPTNAGVVKNGIELGKNHINLVIDRLKPKVVFFGHHHNPYESRIGETSVIGMDQPHHSYLKLNTRDFSIERVNATLEGKLGYRYKWQRNEV